MKETIRIENDFFFDSNGFFFSKSGRENNQSLYFLIDVQDELALIARKHQFILIVFD